MAISHQHNLLAYIVATRARMDHTYLTQSHLFNYEEHPICHQFNQPLAIKSLTLHCVKYNHERSILNHPTNIDVIFNFFSATKLSN